MLCELAQQYKKLSGTSEEHYSPFCRNFIKYVAPNMMVLMICILLFLLRVPAIMAAPIPQGFEEIRQAQQQLQQQQQLQPQQPLSQTQADDQFQGSAVQPQGFSSHSNKRASPRGFGIENSPSPNTIKGVLHNARTDDYVVLEGNFVLQQKGTQAFYQFTDAAGDCITVDLDKANNASAPLPDIKYYLWGTIQRDWFSTVINVIEFTPKS